MYDRVEGRVDTTLFRTTNQQPKTATSLLCVFYLANKPRGASPRRDYVHSEEDGISTNRII